MPAHDTTQYFALLNKSFQEISQPTMRFCIADEVKLIELLH